MLWFTTVLYAGQPHSNHMVQLGADEAYIRISRNSAVYVDAGSKEGSGGLFRIGDHTILISAAHVTGIPGKTGSVVQGQEYYSFEVFYSHPFTDVSFSIVKEHPQTNLIEYKAPAPSSIGETMIYSGYPDSMNASTFIGTLVGGEVLSSTPRYVLNIFSWFGASGSIAFNAKGQPIAVNSSLANLENTSSGENVAMFSLAFFSPLYQYPREEVIEHMCEYGVVSKYCL